MLYDFKKIKAEYIRDRHASYKTLSEKYNVPFSILSKTATKEKWTDLRKKAEEKSEKILVDGAAQTRAKDAEQFNKLADLIMRKIIEGIDSGTIDINQRSMRDITGAIKDLREIKGLKSEADFQEQLARIEKLKKEAQPEQQENKIQVIIGGDAGDFAR